LLCLLPRPFPELSERVIRSNEVSELFSTWSPHFSIEHPSRWCPHCWEFPIRRYEDFPGPFMKLVLDYLKYFDPDTWRSVVGVLDLAFHRDSLFE
jgi:hypothetical protein